VSVLGADAALNYWVEHDDKQPESDDAPCYDDVMVTSKKKTIEIDTDLLQRVEELASHSGQDTDEFILDAIRQRVGELQRLAARQEMLDWFTEVRESRSDPDLSDDEVYSIVYDEVRAMRNEARA
jgi:predicted transcriptional regulator